MMGRDEAQRAREAKRFLFTPDQVADELTDRIEQGWSNDRILRANEDVGPNLRRWLTGRRRKLQRFWEAQ